MTKNFLVNVLLVPDMVQLDMTGPYEVLSRVPGWRIEIISADLQPVRTDRGLRIMPTMTRAAAEPADLLVIPGGTGIDHAMIDPAWVAFVKQQAGAARYVFGICTGSMLLAAAGLLNGRRAGAHWQARDLLGRFGAIPVHDRMVVDGKYFTSGGVTSGIDMALKVVAEIMGAETAQKIQLSIEYDPAPPFPGGTPFTSPHAIVAAVLEAGAARRKEREAMVDKAVAAMHRNQNREAEKT